MKKFIKRISLLLAALSILAIASACGVTAKKDSSSTNSSPAGTSSAQNPNGDNSTSENGNDEAKDVFSDGAELEWDWFE